MQNIIEKNIRLVNKIITKKIIALHDKGYTVDFKICEEEKVCFGDNEPSPVFRDFLRLNSELCYDKLSRIYKYLHTIETLCGKKGLLLTDRHITEFVLKD